MERDVHREQEVETSEREGEQILPSSEVVVGDGQFADSLLRTLDVFRRKHRYTDLVFRTTRGDVPVHRAVMAAVSKTITGAHDVELFYPLHTHNGPAGRTSHSALHVVINYAYTGRAKISVKNVEDVLSLALHFQVAFLVKACQEFIVEHMSENTMLRFLDYAAGFPLDIIKQRCFRYVIDNLGTLVASDDSPAMTLKPVALVEFLNFTDSRRVRGKDGDTEKKLQLAMRYMYLQRDISKHDEMNLAKPVKDLVSKLSDDKLAKCLSVFPNLVNNSSIQHFLYHVGICVKKQISPTHSDYATASQVSFADSGDTLLVHQDFSHNKIVTRSERSRPARSSSRTKRRQSLTPSRRRFEHELCDSSSETRVGKDDNNGQRKSRKSRGTNPSIALESPRHNYKGMSCDVDLITDNGCLQELDMSQNRTVEFHRPPERNRSSESKISPSRQRRIEYYKPKPKPKRPEVSLFRRDKPRVRSPIIKMSPEKHVSRIKSSFKWDDSPRFAHEGFRDFPKLYPEPDIAFRLTEIYVHCHTLANGSHVIGGLTLTFGRVCSSSQSAVTTNTVGFFPSGQPPSDVVRLARGERVTAVSLGVSNIIHRLTFYTSNDRVLGPYGGPGGQSVRVDAPSLDHELYNIRGDSRSVPYTEVLANVVLRWLHR